MDADRCGFRFYWLNPQADYFGCGSGSVADQVEAICRPVDGHDSRPGAAVVAAPNIERIGCRVSPVNLLSLSLIHLGAPKALFCLPSQQAILKTALILPIRQKGWPSNDLQSLRC